jgi:hypothetical protein
VEEAVAAENKLSRPGLWFCVEAVEARGHPPSHLRVWATLHFLATGSPFCCGEPNCHLWLFGERLQRIGDHIRRAMGLRQSVEVDFPDGVETRYHDGVIFHYGNLDSTPE